MAYRDPYYASSNDPYYSQAAPPQQSHYQQPYTDEFDPYNTRQVHPTYDQSGYADEEGFPRAGPRDGALNDVGEDATATGHTREKSKYEEQFPPVLRPPKCVSVGVYLRRELIRLCDIGRQVRFGYGERITMVICGQE